MNLSKETASFSASQNSWLPGSWTMGEFTFSLHMNQDITVSSAHMGLLSFTFYGF